MIEAEFNDIEKYEPWNRLKKLTDKEKEIFKDLCELLTHQEIAEKRDITMKTAKDHAYKIYKKLGVSDLTQRSQQNRLVFLRTFCEVRPKGEVS